MLQWFFWEDEIAHFLPNFVFLKNLTCFIEMPHLYASKLNLRIFYV